MDRDCNNCIYHTDRGCTKWECEMEIKRVTRMTEVKYNIGGNDMIAKYDENGIMEITRECFEMLIEKEIPKKSIGKSNVCPKCGVIEFGFNEPNYCEWCGQKIDWGNEDDRAD